MHWMDPRMICVGQLMKMKFEAEAQMENELSSTDGVDS